MFKSKSKPALFVLLTDYIIFKTFETSILKNENNNSFMG